MTEQRRVFVIGRNGQVAQAVAHAYGAHGDVVVAAGRPYLDVADPVALAAAVASFRPDLVVNAAAYTAVDKAEDDREQAFRINCEGARHASAVAHAAGAPLIHISTDYVFDGTKAQPYVETDPTHPIGVYGASKLAGEHAIAATTPDYVILRTSWVCSPVGSNFVKTMLRLASERDEITVVDDQWGAPTFAADLADAIVTIGEKLLGGTTRSRISGVYHLSGTGETTWFRFAVGIMAQSKRMGGPACRVRPISTSEYPTRAHRPANSRLNCSKAAGVFGIELPLWETSLDACLEQLVTVSQRIAK